jgi:PAS domain S-box-containing protein
VRTAPVIDKYPRPDAAPAPLPADELSRFERLLVELSAGFINLPAGRIDEAIDDGLRRIVEALDIERSTLNSRSPTSGQIEMTHSYAVPGVDRAYTFGAGPELWPWAWSRLRANQPVVFERVDDLPPEASIDRANYERIGLKSHVTMPMIVDGELYGGLSFGSIRRERAWPEELLERMRLLAQIFGSALARKRAQLQLEESEARLDAIVRSALHAILAVDAEQRVVLFNAAAERMFGCSASQAIGAPLDHFIPERFRAAHRAHVERFGRTGETSRPMGASAALWALRADGTEFPIEASISQATIGGQQLLTVILRDVTDRVRAAREIDQALEFERLLADLSASMLRAPSLDPDRAIPDALRAIGEFLRIDRVALWWVSPKDDHFSLMHWWSAPGVPPPPATLRRADVPWFSDRLLRGEVVRFADPGELPARATPDGKLPQGLGTRSLLLVPLWVDGDIAAVLSLAVQGAARAWPDALVPRVTLFGEALATLLQHDRKARQLAEAQSDAAQFRERLAHLVRVHTVGEMSAALAHEITQPLGAIENYALAARRRANEASPDLPKVLELIDKMIGQAARAGEVVTRLRGLVKRHDLELKALDVEGAVRTCIDMVKTDCELRDLRIELNTAGALPVVVADEIHVQQVILNLLRNAIEAMTLAPPHADWVITVETALRGPDEVSVRIADRGPGIAEGDLERVFESFYSSKPAGLGVGLAICRKLIEAHGGALWAAHNPGGGAAFQFTLPVRAVED